MLEVLRVCPTCKHPAKGVQQGSDPDWHSFVCKPCEEEWGENIRYCTPEEPLESLETP